MDEAFGNWLAGFIDGEGSFSIFRTGPRASGYALMFQLQLRSDDAAILREIAAGTEIGNVRARVRHEGNDLAVWHVSSKADCRALADLLDRFPLRAKKARDYMIWRAALVEWEKIARGPRKNNWDVIAAHRDALMAGRALVPL